LLVTADSGDESSANSLSGACRFGRLGPSRLCRLRDFRRIVGDEWAGLIWIHLAAVFWGIAIELSGWICPLTPLENWLRHKGGEENYQFDFVAHYLLPMLYPQGLTRRSQIVLGALVLVVNGAIYGWILGIKKGSTVQ
jgi:hypothetical protein